MQEIHLPFNWKSVELDGNPEEGLYVAMYRDDDGNLVVSMLDYYGDDSCGHMAGFGWCEMDYENWDYDYVTRDVVAYFPANLDMSGLVKVRERFKQ